MIVIFIPAARCLWAKKYFAFIVCMGIIGLLAGFLLFVQLEIQYLESLIRSLGADAEQRILVHQLKWEIRYISLIVLAVIWYMAGVVK